MKYLAVLLLLSGCIPVQSATVTCGNKVYTGLTSGHNSGRGYYRVELLDGSKVQLPVALCTVEFRK